MFVIITKMAYGKKYSKRSYKRTYKSKYKRRSREPSDDNAVAEFARNGFFLAKKLKRLINVEHKHKVIAFSKSVDSTGICIPLFHNDASHTHAISVGDTHYERNGNSIKPLTLTVKGTCWVPKATTAPSGGDTLRVIIFKHQQNNGQTVGVTDYLQTNNVRDFKNYDNRFQYKTLYDKAFNLTGTESGLRNLNVFRKLFGHTTYETGSDDIETGAYYMLLLSTTSTVGNMPEVRVHARMTYTDN